MKKKCWCGRPEGHSEKEIARDLAKLDKILRDSIVEYKTPKENGEIGTILGVPTFIKK